MAGGKAGKDSGKMKAKAVSRSAKSGLQFPVGRIHRHLKSRTTSHGRIGATAAVYRFPFDCDRCFRCSEIIGYHAESMPLC